MTKIMLIALFSFAIILSGCGSSEKTDNTDAQKTVAKNESKPAAKVEEKKADTKSVEKKVEEKTEEKKAEVKADVKPAEGKDEWVLVFSTNAKIEEQDKVRLLDTVKAKWFSTRKYEYVEPKDYQNNMSKYIGRIVIIAEARSDNGELEFTIRTGKVIDDKGDAVEEGVAKGVGIEDSHIRGQDTVDNLIREIKFLK